MSTDLSVKNVTKTFGSFTAVDDVSFDVEDGRFFSILGPSGCGKTTLLRMIAGFLEPTGGRIEIRGQNMAGLPPNRRPVNLIFQHLALFPMMDVGENVAFGLRRRGEKKETIRRKVRRILERVELPGFEKKRINQLSGGQKQRVAIARCLVLEPTVLLLDEPLGALDLKLREQMKVELKKLQTQVGTTFVYITHDQSEALVMSDHVAVMNKGRFEQLDTPQNLYSAPKTPFVAAFVGENNSWKGRIVSLNDHAAEMESEDGQRFSIGNRGNISIDTKVVLYIRPEAMLISPEKNRTDLNRFSVMVKSILFDGANSRLLVMPMESTTEPGLRNSPTNDFQQEMLVALPQNRQFDHIRPNDQIKIGWDPHSGICFPVGKDSL